MNAWSVAWMACSATPTHASRSHRHRARPCTAASWKAATWTPLARCALVQMIQLQRQYEMQVQVIKHGDENARSANSMLRLGS